MTRVPTSTTDPLRATAIAGNGVRGEKSPAAIPTGDFLQSLLSFSSGMGTQSITTDLRFNQLVGALQLNRPGGSKDDFGPLQSRAAASSLDTVRTDTDELAEDDPDSERDRENDQRRVSAEVLANLDWRAGQLRASLSDSRFRQTGSAHDETGASGSLVALVDPERFANRRSEGFPTAERAAAIELARREGLSNSAAFLGDTQDATDGASDPLAELGRYKTGEGGAEGGLRLDGQWERVLGGEALVGGPRRVSTLNAAVADGNGPIELQRPGQLDPASEALTSDALSRSVGEPGEQADGWQLSFQADRSGVRSGRLNLGSKGKAREGLKPDGVGPLDRTFRLGPEGPATPVARQDLSLSGPVIRPGSQFSLDELSVAPAAARALWESGLCGTVPPVPASIAGVATDMLADLAVPATNGSTSPAGALSPVETPGLPPSVSPVETATNDFHLSSGAGPVDVSSAADVDGGVPEIASGPRSLPARLLNQVAQALREAPAGDSTLRLQLNPVDLGQLSIEISFRDGVMHGKLRAEQGQTLKWLQEGLDGLKARLSDQGIVVQALEVELGQQGDFSQQSGSFSPGPDLGRQRSGRGYFTPDGPNRRAAASDQQTTIQPTTRDTSGQWAVNVIV